MPSPFAILFSLCVVMIVIIVATRDPKDKSHRQDEVVQIQKPRHQCPADNKKRYSYSYMVDILNEADECETIEEAQKYKKKLEAVYAEALVDDTSAFVIEDFEEILGELEDTVHEKMVYTWKKEADAILAGLRYSFRLITDAERHGFENVEDVIEEKAECLSLYDEYFTMSSDFIEKYQCYGLIHVKDYFEQENPFEREIQNAWELEQVLDAAIEPLKPEQKRKKKLYRDILNWVAEQESVQQCALLKQEFPNATAEEVKYCYKDMVKQYRLVKYKMGNRWFVMLSDKEKERREKEAQKAAERKQKAQAAKAAKEAEAKEEEQAE